MKSMMKTLLVSAMTIACANAVYAQGGGGAGGAGGSAGGAGAGAGGGTAGYGSGTAPGGNSVNQPPSTRSNRDTSGYGTPGSTGSRMGNGGTTATPGDNNPSNSNSTGNYKQ
jgi:hypothetical protein